MNGLAIDAVGFELLIKRLDLRFLIAAIAGDALLDGFQDLAVADLHVQLLGCLQFQLVLDQRIDNRFAGRSAAFGKHAPFGILDELLLDPFGGRLGFLLGMRLRGHHHLLEPLVDGLAGELAFMRSPKLCVSASQRMRCSTSKDVIGSSFTITTMF